MIFRYAIICLMALTVLFVIHLLIIRLNYSEVSALSRKSDTAQKHNGLYSAADKVALLTAANFNENVYNSSSAWMVQFYNSWCGHCIKFAPYWKKLGADIYNWYDVVTISSIDCADDQNTQHCRDYEIMGYPTIRYFEPMTTNFTIGREFQRTRDDPTSMRHALLDVLVNTEKKKMPHKWPNLLPLENIDSMWEYTNKNLMLLVIENETSYLGRELIMDLKNVSDLSVKRILDSTYGTKAPKPQLKVLSRIKTVDENIAEINAENRTTFYNSMRQQLKAFAVEIPDIFSLNFTAAREQYKLKQSPKQQLLVNTVFQTDLESAFSYSLFHEVNLKPVIENEMLAALTRYLQILSKYFPFVGESGKFLEKIIDELSGYEKLTGGQFKELVLKHDQKFSQKPREWEGCKGSVATYRGYPCGLWMMFHTLTVKAYASPQGVENPTEVLDAMTGYIKYFFGCQDCSEHFLEMSKTISGNVSSPAQSVLWLWRAHNNVNKRLAGDGSEDPSFPKIQFPHHHLCPECRDEHDSWREKEVLNYLTSMYSNVQRFDITSTDALQTEPQAGNQSGWNFSLSDVNTCIVLYVLCACLLTMYTVRFFLKRNPRNRHHKYDLSSKA